MTGPDVNRHGADWMALRRWNVGEINRHREELESLTVTPDRAQQLRGMISALRQQIDYVEPAQAPIVKDPHYG